MKRKSTKPVEYQQGKVRSIVEYVAKVVLNNESIARDVAAGDYGLLHSTISYNVPGYGAKDACVGCGRSMKITVYEADLQDGLLIYAMARAVREEMRKGIPFTEANKVHIPTLVASHATLKRQTKCDYLGLVKQQENWRGSGYWCLTGWAWKLLRGDAIPESVKYWEGKMLGRSDKIITLSQIFQKHRDRIERAIQKRQEIAHDHRAEFADYSQSEWSEFGGYIDEESSDKLHAPQQLGV